MTFLRTGAAAVLLSLSAACAPDSERIASVSGGRAGFEAVSRAASGILRKDAVMSMSAEEIAANARRASALVEGRVVSADDAVQVALLNNRGLQAKYAQLGVSSADVWQSIMRPNPVVSLGIVDPGNGEFEGFRSIEGMIAFNLVALLTREDRRGLAEFRFRQDQLRAVEATLAVAADTRRAWIDAVAAFERASLIRDAEETADAASELAARLGDTGFLNRAEQAREHAFFADLSGESARARLDADLAKERLTRLMGLWGADLRYRVPDALPRLPASIVARPGIEADALENRVDLALAKLELSAAARAQGLTEATRYATDIELVTGLEVEHELDDGAVERETIPSVEVEYQIPIFDNGQARLKRAEAAYMIAAHSLAERAVTVRSEARSAYKAYAGHYRIARHYRDAVLLLRRIVEEESLLSYNAMITNTFDLLEDTRGRLDSSLGEAEARHRFWLADANLLTAIYGGGAETGGGGGAVELAQRSGDEGH